jgi:hypothetical protein
MIISFALTVDPQRPNLQHVVQTVADLLQNTVAEAREPSNVAFLAQHFQKPVNIESLLCNSSLFERARRDSDSTRATKAEHQLSAKLHCLYGVPIQHPKRTKCKAVYPYATAKVYDLRQYTDKTFWGPFIDDGSQNVDWEKVEAIMIVLGHNLQIFSDRTIGLFEPIWTAPFSGAHPDSYLSPPAPLLERPLDSVDVKDPYYVTGTWMRVSSKHWIFNI